MKALPLLLFILALHTAGAVERLPEGGRDLLAPEELAKAAYSTKVGGAATWVKVHDAPVSHAWRLDIPSAGQTPWQAQLSLPIPAAETIRAGDILLLTFYARGGVPADSTETAGGNISVENREPPNFLKLGVGGFTVGPAWQPMYIPFQAGAAGLPGKSVINWQVALRAQTLEIGGVRLIHYGDKTELRHLPRPYVHYRGREADAPWRKAALERIERNRVRAFSIRVSGSDGRPATNAVVRARLLRHDFNFGTAVKAHFMMGDDPRSAKYREMVDRNFSCIVFENDLKPAHFPAGASNTNRVYRHEWIRRTLDWCRERGIKTRGHYLMIGVWEPWSEALRNDPARLRSAILGHMKAATGTFGADIDEWDVLNHPVGWVVPHKTLGMTFGPDFYAGMIREARALVKTPLYINEDQVFRPGHQQEGYYKVVQELVARGAAPDGIGNQGHFHSSFLPAPEEMLRVSDRFAALVPKLNITEFDVATNGDEELQADWLRDCLIMAYSHPAYTGFLLWVFWEGTGYKAETALWRRDWSERPNATVWRQWVCEKWRTDVTGKTGADGRFALRGHAGLYEITAEVNNRTVTTRVPLVEAGAAATVSLAAPSTP